MNTNSTVEGRFIGYLPFEGSCEIKLDNGTVQFYGLSSELTKMTRALPDLLYPFLYKFLICYLSDYDAQVIERLEIHPKRE